MRIMPFAILSFNNDSSSCVRLNMRREAVLLLSWCCLMALLRRLEFIIYLFSHHGSISIGESFTLEGARSRKHDWWLPDLASGTGFSVWITRLNHTYRGSALNKHDVTNLPKRKVTWTIQSTSAGWFSLKTDEKKTLKKKEQPIILPPTWSNSSWSCEGVAIKVEWRMVSTSGKRNYCNPSSGKWCILHCF
jgi:hypothetical protein